MAVKEASPIPELTDQLESNMGFHYSSLSFLRTMLAIAWSAFAHPFSSTVIDLATGQVHHVGREERE